VNYELQGERKKLNKPYLGFKVCTQGGGEGGRKIAGTCHRLKSVVVITRRTG